jgi:predicted nucleotidyltransferase
MDIIKQFISELKEIYAENLQYVLLYGSQARGTSTAESDIDLLIVLDHFDDFWKENSKIKNLAYKVTFAAGKSVVISALPVTLKQYKAGATPFLLNVKKESKIIK